MSALTLEETRSALCPGSAAETAPEIAHVWPDFLTTVPIPHVMTGEGFDSEGLEVWVWAPGHAGETLIPVTLPLPLPALPPAEARRVEPIDVERQVIVACLSGVAVWVRTRAGWSAPYRLNAPRVFWLSHAAAQPGAWLHLCGFGVQREQDGFKPPHPYLVPDGEVLLRGAAHSVRIRSQVEGRSTQWVSDSHLLYFRIPLDTPSGSYDVFLHNGQGGSYGWTRVGALTVSERSAAVGVTFDARAFGVRGDGIADDLPALQAALAAAADSGGTVALPPGTYCIRATLCVPEGVTLRGAGQENTLIAGAGYDPTSGVPPAAVIRLTDRTSLHALTVCGAVGAGLPSVICARSDMSVDSMVRLEPARVGQPVEQVGIYGCRIRALEEDPQTRETLYLKAIQVGPDHYGRCRHVSLNNNEIHGSFFFWRGERLEIIRNTWLHSTPTILVAIHGWATDSLLDANLFRDTPGRLCFYPLRHCYLRHNEIHGAFRGSWTNAEEVYLVHGRFEDYFEKTDHRRVTGTAGGGTATALIDAAQDWIADEHRDAVVLITGGRGFGQYRRVVGNTASALTVEEPWRVPPGPDSTYVVGWMYCENAFFANLNDTPLRMSFWYDAIGTVIERHRDEFSKGIDFQGGDDRTVDADGVLHAAHAYHPSWYNVIANGWLDGAAIELYSHVSRRGLPHAPSLFATAVVANRIRQPHAYRTGNAYPVIATGGLLVGGVAGTPDVQAGGRRPDGLSHTIVANNQFAFTPIGIHIGENASKTFVINNTFQQVDAPIFDKGVGTRLQGNRQVTVVPGSVQSAEVAPP